MQSTLRHYDAEYRTAFPDGKLNKYEVARAIGMRAFALSYGAPPVPTPGKPLRNNAIDIAICEMDHQVLPVKILRHHPSGIIEYQCDLYAHLDISSDQQ